MTQQKSSSRPPSSVLPHRRFRHWLRALNTRRHRPLAYGLLAALTYLVLSLLWITLSDEVLFAMDLSAEEMRRLSMLKGWGFVTVMAVIVGVLVYVLQSRYAELQDAIRNSSHDLVTGTGNRQAAMDNLDRAMTQSRGNGQQFAVLMIDIRQLHRVNASLGRSGGDRALWEVAQRLLEGLRKQDMLARLESDKFLVVMPPQTDTSVAYRMAMSLSTLFERPIRVHGVEVAVQIATSVVLGPGEHANAGELLDAAEAALLNIKRRGFQSGSTPQSALVSSREALQFESELRLAPGKDEFTLHLQPQYSLQDGNLVGAEVLVRWQHPHLGVLPPDRFIPIAEAAGFIPDITAAVVQNTCRLQREMADSGVPKLNLSINFSAIDLAMTESLNALRAAMREFSVAGGQLTVEITESALMRDPAMAKRVLSELRDMGVKVAIDDFGTGHSSLNYLNRFPVDVLKVDRSFVSGVSKDERGIALLRAINDMAHAMGLQTLAEGVETAPDHAMLTELGFDSAQGFLYSHPLALNEFLDQHLDPETRRWIRYPRTAGSRP